MKCCQKCKHSLIHMKFCLKRKTTITTWKKCLYYEE